MTAIILAGGYATRLYPLTLDTHKALLPLNGKVILDVVIEKVAAIPDLERVVIITNEKFYGQFSTWSETARSSVPVHIINDGSRHEDERFGSIGDLAIALDQGNISDDVIVVASDNLFGMCLSDFIAFSRERSDAVALAVYDVKSLEAAKLYGTVVLDDDGAINEFIEKPPQPKTSLVSMGVYYFPRNKKRYIQTYLDEGNNPDKMGSLIEWMIKRDKVYGYVFDGWWVDIGTKAMYEQARQEFLRKE